MCAHLKPLLNRERRCLNNIQSYAIHSMEKIPHNVFRKMKQTDFFLKNLLLDQMLLPFNSSFHLIGHIWRNNGGTNDVVLQPKMLLLGVLSKNGWQK